VLATHYEESVVARLCNGKTHLTTALQPLVLAAEQAVELAEETRRRTLARSEAGGGSVAEVNWLLGQGYQVQCQDSSGTRAQPLAASVPQWVADPRVPARQVGWVPVTTTP